MLSALLVAFTLEGVLPGLTRVRRPVPVVRYDRIREPRGRTNLRAIARRLLGADEPAVPAAVLDRSLTATRSASGATGARLVFFEGA